MVVSMGGSCPQGLKGAMRRLAEKCAEFKETKLASKEKGGLLVQFTDARRAPGLTTALQSQAHSKGEEY
jgi:hypothetical protein